MQQTLLLLAYLYANRSGTTLLLDEPDAHLEFCVKNRFINESLRRRIPDSHKSLPQVIRKFY